MKFAKKILSNLKIFTAMAVVVLLAATIRVICFAPSLVGQVLDRIGG